MSRNIRNAVNHAAVDHDYAEEILVTSEGQIKKGDSLRIDEGNFQTYTTCSDSRLMNSDIELIQTAGGRCFYTFQVLAGKSWAKKVYIVKSAGSN